MRVAVRYLPEKRAIALRLYDWQLQISGVFGRHSRPVWSMALRAIPEKKLMTAGRCLGLGRKGISAGCGRRRWEPILVLMVTRILAERRYHSHNDTDRHGNGCSHGFRPNSFEILLPRP